ncbi:MAG: hypothetical protein ACI89X_001823 [Planctomycetota bacterium]|jgi:hypothetical protein
MGFVNFARPTGLDGARAALQKANPTWPQSIRRGEDQEPVGFPMPDAADPCFYLPDDKGDVIRCAYSWSVIQAILEDR